ncbi:ABC-F family ATP-binding cassette domain-containing protein [Aeromicrobium sp. YIM 150415]|uniref:ABC-F family ATP-binding cassette domain-containing protein n=1 Tax=Aeromicrobium sp. YIM 150415 TaxID=2803912 RepID=UPI00196352F2|nr:ABC-F family ATP-binding cassette domain-containing protein [Aeromicrobium sp. YIM 150415]MBM9461983.1 ABC-F family ATP-binding cassette domain-containing protein [Aeromicrobium sp. YIM 150415]
MPPLIVAEKVHVAFPTAGPVLRDVTLGLAEGDRVGVVGRNGDGKSTLLRVLARELEPDSGRVTWRRDLAVGYVDQSDVLDPAATVRDAVVGDALDHEWAGDARTRDIVSGLVPPDVAWEARIGELSGGQRRRVALASVLARSWDVLVLDEPTNHLDLDAVVWLAGHLRQRWPAGSGALAVITHDRWFLDEVCTTTWEVHDGTVDAFEGGYAAYVLQRVERDRQAAASEARRQNLMRKELAWLRRGAPARTSKPKFRIDAANELIGREPPVRDGVELTQLATARLGKDVVDLLDVDVDLPDGRPVLRDIEWRIGPGERTGILGVNGAGKSTLLGLVTGGVAASRGRVKRGKTVEVAVLSQSLHELDDVAEERVSDLVGRQRATYVAGGKELTPGQLLERLGFRTQQLSTPIKDLSGGQRRRLQLLLILLAEPNVLILDEPTNDMDTDMLTAIEDLLDTWPGTLLVVSHDRYLLERVTDQQYAILDGRLRHLPGGVDEYLVLREKQEQERDSASGAPRGVSQSEQSGLSGAERRSVQKDIASVERRMEKLSASVDALHARLAAHDQSDYEGLQRHTEELRTVEDEIARLEERWLELSESLD